MSIGEKIIREVGQLSVIDNVGSPLIFGCPLLAWKPNAEERLEALVEEYVQQRMAKIKSIDTMRLDWLEQADIMIQFNTLDSVRFNCPHFQVGMPLRWALDKGLEQEAKRKGLNGGL